MKDSEGMRGMDPDGVHLSVYGGNLDPCAYRELNERPPLTVSS